MKKKLLNEIPLLSLLIASPVVLGVMGTAALYGAWRSAALAFSKAHRICRQNPSGPKRNLCLALVRLTFLTKKERILKQVLEECDKQNSKQKTLNCRNKVKSRLDSLKEKIQKQSDDVQELKQQFIFYTQNRQMK